MIRLITFFLLINSFVYGQNEIEFVSLNSHDSQNGGSDLAQIDSIFKNVQLVGIGECTHGTSQFTSMRHRIFKYLVETEGFNTLFIEADYSACLRLNRYINGETDTVDKSIFELLYFAWTTEEFKVFVGWLREHNLKTADKIQIVGCDMQSISDDKVEIEQILRINDFRDSIPGFFDSLTYPYQDTNEIKKALIIWSNFYSNSLNKRENNSYSLINATVTQFLTHKLNITKQNNYRDSCMAINIVTYLNQNPNLKGMWFAHNGHVSKTEYQYTTKSSFKTSGQFLSDNIGSGYLSIAQTTNIGDFNAWKYIKRKPVFSVCKLKKAKRNSLEYVLSKLDANLLVCKYSSIDNVNKLKYTEIGHTYGKTNAKYKVKRYKKLKEGKFDYVIYFESTNETKLLTR